MAASLGIFIMKKLVKMMKQVKMIKRMIMRFRNVGPGQTKVSLRLTRNFGQP